MLTPDQFPCVEKGLWRDVDLNLSGNAIHLLFEVNYNTSCCLFEVNSHVRHSYHKISLSY